MSDQDKENAAPQQDKTENKENAPPPKQGDSSSWYEKPESIGNKYGDKIQDTLSPVGEPVGNVLQKGTAPVGSLVDGTVGGIMRMGKGFGDQVGVGFGNEEGGPAKQKEAEGKRMKEDIGGKEQTADNPLGL